MVEELASRNQSRHHQFQNLHIGRLASFLFSYEERSVDIHHLMLLCCYRYMI